MKKNICEECGREIVGAEYYALEKKQTKRRKLCEECYIDDDNID